MKKEWIKKYLHECQNKYINKFENKFVDKNINKYINNLKKIDWNLKRKFIIKTDYNINVRTYLATTAILLS